MLVHTLDQLLQDMRGAVALSAPLVTAAFQHVPARSGALGQHNALLSSRKLAQELTGEDGGSLYQEGRG